MKTISLEHATDVLNEMARGEVSEPSVVTVDGRPIAALVPLDDFDLENLSLMQNADFRRLLEESSRQMRETGGIPHEEIRRRFGLA
jgi:antitoxin (DNA-binding transcriptional repressor) of toxin-antitoxin stability system